MNIKAIKKLYIHDGRFNTDDVVSAAMIKLANENIILERVGQKPIEEEGTLLLGLGGALDYKNKENRVDQQGDLYCLMTYASELCLDIILDEYGIKNMERAKELFYNTYIEKVSIGTRNRFFNRRFFKENDILLSFNLEWYEKGNDDEQFFKAVELMLIVLENWLKQTKEDSDLRSVEDEIWKKAEKASEDGIYILERHIPWQYQVKKNPDTKAKIIIFKSNRGGYNVVSKSTDEIKIQDSEYLSFVHPSRFMGVADSLNNAILAARQTVLNSAA